VRLIAGDLFICRASDASPASSVAVIAGPYDGKWTGKWMSADGRSISLVFAIQSSAFTSFTYTYAGLNGLSCTGIAYEQIPTGQQPKIVNGSFSDTFGADLIASGKFPTQDAAAGQC
jgi:hypothetical protein